MEDAAQVHSQTAAQGSNFVLRRFSPARIERLLLTRLFDLTTGRHVPGEQRGESSGAPSSRSQLVERREAHDD